MSEPAPIVVPSPTRVAAAEADVRLEGDVLGQLDGRLDVGGRRVVHRHAGQQVALVDLGPQVALGLGQLEAVVDAEQAAVVLDDDRAARPRRPRGRSRTRSVR